MLPDTDADPNDDVELEAQDDELDGDSDANEHDEIDGDEGGGADDDSQEDDAGRDEGKAGQPDKVRATGRAKNDFGRLREERRIATEKAERLERELAETRNALSGRQSEEQKRAEAEKLALMTADEKLEHYRAQDKQELARTLGSLQFQMQDNADKAEFRQLCRENSALAAVAEEVERTIQSERSQGRAGASREIVAAYLIGKRALANGNRSKAKQQKRGDASKERNAARATNSRSNVSSATGRGTDAEQRRKRLEGIEL